MQEFEHTSRYDRTYTEEERSCPYFDECYIQVRNQGACRFNCQDNPYTNKKKYILGVDLSEREVRKDETDKCNS